MARPIGLPKTGGRRKGTVNKRTQNLMEILEQLNTSLPQMALNLLPDLKPEKQADVILKLMDFVYPKRKSMDLSLTNDRPYQTLAEIVDQYED